MTGKGNRTKGASAERECAHIINAALDTNIHRELGQERNSGHDLTLYGKYKIEVKRQENCSIPAWCRQIEACCDVDDIPVVCYRSSRQPWRVVLQLNDFLELLKYKKKDEDKHG